jgi:hypothetical protein
MVRAESRAYCWDIPPERRTGHMFRYTLSYARYVLTALSTVAFKLAAN